MKSRVLITGFNSFSKININPSETLANELFYFFKNSETYKQSSIAKVIFKTSYERSELQLEQIVERFKPTHIVAFGVSSSIKFIKFEKVGKNLDNATTPDNEGIIRQNSKISVLGKESYKSTLVYDEVFRKATENQIPIKYSNNAGGYLCNHILYYGLCFIEENFLDIKMGFIHIPKTTDYTSEEYKYSLRVGKMIIESTL